MTPLELQSMNLVIIYIEFLPLLAKVSIHFVHTVIVTRIDYLSNLFQIIFSCEWLMA